MLNLTIKFNAIHIGVCDAGTVGEDILKATVTVVSSELCDGDGWQNSDDAVTNAM